MKRSIDRAAVIGSGVMGSGIAALLASAGIPCLLLDIVPPGLTTAENENPKARNRIVDQGFKNLLKAHPPALMHPSDATRIETGNLEDNFQKLAECDWILEAVVENLEIKQALFQRLETVRKSGAILSTNTSGIPLAKIGAALSPETRQYFMGTHFFNPVRYMHLLELIPGEETLPEVLAFMAAFGEKTLGKGIVWAKDTPCFIGNRIGVHASAQVFEEMMALELSIPEVDAIMGPAMGRPKTAIFRLGDLVGVDIMANVARNTYQLVVDDEAREIIRIPPFIEAMVEKGYLGKKSGSGFYKMEKNAQGRKTVKVINPATLTYEDYDPPSFACLEVAAKCSTLPEKLRAMVYGQDRGARFAWRQQAAALIYAANRIPEIAGTIVAIDDAMRWGYNFAMGPFEVWDAIGVAESVARMEAEGMVVPAKVVEMLAAGHTSFYKEENGERLFYDFADKTYHPVPVSPTALSLKQIKGAGAIVATCPSASLIDLGEGIFCCEFHTKMNALNSELVDFIHQSMEIVGAQGAGLVFGNQTEGARPAFSAGADLKEMVTAAQAKKFDQIRAAIRRMQGAMQKARYAPFPVVAAPYGLTLGGGCEVALGADRMVAGAELYMGLVEVGVGLLPGGGGCLNLWRKLTASLPPGVAGIELTPFFVAVFQDIAMAKVSSSAADARHLGFLGSRDRIVFNPDTLIGEAKREVLTLLADGYRPPARKPLKVLGRTAQGLINAQLSDMQRAGYISAYDAFIAKKVAFVIAGGDAVPDSAVDDDLVLRLEEEAFIALLKEEKTQARIAHMLKTGKPLRN